MRKNARKKEIVTAELGWWYLEPFSVFHNCDFSLLHFEDAQSVKWGSVRALAYLEFIARIMAWSPNRPEYTSHRQAAIFSWKYQEKGKNQC